MMLDAKGNYLRKSAYDRLSTIHRMLSNDSNWPHPVRRKRQGIAARSIYASGTRRPGSALRCIVPAASASELKLTFDHAERPPLVAFAVIEPLTPTAFRAVRQRQAA
jgi:hypothetical protein